ncbi:DoxX family protein [Nakamurella sp. GG22]
MTNLAFRTSTVSTRQDVVLLLGRVVLGVVLIAHGWQKFATNGISGTAAAFDQMGVPLSTASATFAAVVELVGGIALIIGFAVPVVGLLVALDMVGALLFVHAENGIFVGDGGYELVAVIGALAFVLAGVGAGRYSIDGLISPASRRR